MKKELIIVVVGLFLLFLFVQLHFLSYYNVFGIPFGKVDVDSYMHSISESGVCIDHVLITVIPLILASFIDPAFLYTVTVPFFACIILPLTLFIFAYYFSKNYMTAFLSVIIMLFGTFTLQVYLITALWAQMLATIFALWSIIFIEHYCVTGNKSLIPIAVFSSIFTILSHPAGFAMVLIFTVIKAYNRVSNKEMFISISVISGLFGVYIINTFTDMFGEYVYDVTLEYLLRNFAASVIWGFAACGVFLLVLKSKQLSLVLVAGVIMAISPLFILWRPLISILPLVAYFAALWVTLLIESHKYSLNDYIFIIILISAVAVLMVWFITTSTAGFMNAMLWEMEAEDGLVDGLPRVVNSTIVRDMYFGGVHACYIVMDDYDNMVSQRCY